MTFDAVATAAGVSRSWLYTQPDLRAEIERLRAASQRAPGRPVPIQQRASDAWDNIKGALLGLVTTRVQEFLAEAIPGFRQEFSRTEAYKTTSATHKAPELAESVYRQRANGPTSEWSTHS